MRGKVVFFRGFNLPTNEGKENWGINIYNNWPKDGIATFTNDGNSFYVEDHYFASQTEDHDTKQKAKEVRQAIFQAASSRDNRMYLIFNSVSMHIIVLPGMYAWGGLGVDPAMNPALSYILAEVKNAKGTKFRTGVVLMDFFKAPKTKEEKHLAWKIIESNF